MDRTLDPYSEKTSFKRFFSDCVCHMRDRRVSGSARQVVVQDRVEGNTVWTLDRDRSDNKCEVQ